MTVHRCLRTAQRFARWVDATGIRRKQIAIMLGCDPSYVTHLAAGRMTPGLRLAATIERESQGWKHGPIRAAEWVATARNIAA